MQDVTMAAEKDEYQYKFSIIMSVYNVEEYIEEAVESILQQDIGFKENVQVVFVDDGSTDNSGKICDDYRNAYPDNIIVVHKENGGLSSARNEGLKHVKGEYVNFFDPDDILSINTLREVRNFFDEKGEEIDIVSIPLIFFGDKKGQHPLNNKFNHGTRVINLDLEPNCFQLSAASSFFKNRMARMMDFDTQLTTAEDAKEIIKLLLHSRKLGVVSDVKYYYRFRNTSIVRNARKKITWYKEYLLRFSKWVLDYSNFKLGEVPLFVQYTVMYDLQWKIQEQHKPEILSAEEFEETKKVILEVLSRLDDLAILAQKQIFVDHKLWILKLKNENAFQRFLYNNTLLLCNKERAVLSVENLRTRIHFIHIKDNTLEVEFSENIPVATDFKDVRAFLNLNGKYVECMLLSKEEHLFFWDEVITERWMFRIAIPLTQLNSKNIIRFVTLYDGIKVEKHNIFYDKYAPISNIKHAFYFKNGYMLTRYGREIRLEKCGRKKCIEKELKFLRELWKKQNRKAVAVRLMTHILRAVNKKSIWLIADKADRADDNGEALYLYINKQKDKDIKAYFLVSKESKDYKRLKQYGSVVPYMSWRHKILYLLADNVISAYSHDEINNPFNGYSEPYRDLLQKCKFIFLQHGITKDDISKNVNKYHKNIAMFVCAAKEEYESIRNQISYGYFDDEVVLTGFPRYDRLYNDMGREIVIMPTWRRDLFGNYHAENSRWDLKPGFKESDYYKFYNNLLNHDRLLKSAKKWNYTINFVPHPVFFPYVEKFEIPNEITLWNTNVVYRDIFARNKLLITDFSSVAFDFAYLRKPVLYAHFDQNHYKEGYFDYERDGLGEVCYDIETLVDKIIEYIETDCKLKEKYRERIEEFFEFFDKKNCERVYEKIKILER